MMAVGKTTIGKLLAEQLGYAFHDTDKVIRERCGADIPWIFDVEGEQGFRDREQRVIEELTRLPSVVLATGGGVVMRAANRAALSLRGRVVYLYADLDTLVSRVCAGHQRPMLQGHDPRARLARLLCERAPLYEQVADVCVHSASCGPQSAVTQLLGKLHDEQSDA